MSRVFRNDNGKDVFDPDGICGDFSLLLFETDDPNESATRVFNSGVVSSCGPIWQLRDMDSHELLDGSVKSRPVWREVTDDPEVQAALRSLDKETSVA